VIENAVVYQLAQRGDVPSGAVAALDRFRAAIKHPDKIAEVVKSDVDFHRTLVAATGSPRLRRLHESVIGEAHMCMLQVQIHQLLHPQIIAKEHARILAMIETRNADEARQEMDAHISRARDRLLAYLRRRASEVASDQLAEAL
jgi:DNA-binding GntR family transcriptional regulator